MTDLQTAINSALRAAAETQALSPAQIDALVRTVWNGVQASLGGETVYIHSKPKTARNAAIRAAWQRGQPFALIARDFDLSESRVRQIIATARKATPP